MAGPSIAMSGFITRDNLITGALPALEILVDPYWPIMGDTAEAADVSMHAGVVPAQSATKYVWADSPYVRGKQLVLATPDNSTLDLRLVIDGTSMLDMQAKIAPIITAIRDQTAFVVAIAFDGASYAWSCYTGDYLVAMNQLFMFGYLCPLYVTLPRDPTPFVGPV
jgi:hypothetical protein